MSAHHTKDARACAHLAPCPFCGMKARLFPMLTSGFSVSCLHCEAEGPMRRTEPEAIEAWNSRAPIRAAEGAC
ncbi:hypothetical protein WL14_00645 [Burkholderia cepacia]|uniref:Lar family restriction alleviation protein n=1 Tax=Burkholderia cepacia TaxID=292 RepID=UPI00076077A4|nr:Lar family restriction alleviation protein [Burkholderia cepacia]KVZ26986.1 hypothetical protein WL14_00645 [Burkholderia cepacia]